MLPLGKQTDLGKQVSLCAARLLQSERWGGRDSPPGASKWVGVPLEGFWGETIALGLVGWGGWGEAGIKIKGRGGLGW